MTDPTRCPDHPPAGPFDGMSLPDLCRAMPMVSADPRKAHYFEDEASADRSADALMVAVGGRGDVETVNESFGWVIVWTARTGRRFVVRRPIGGDR